MSDRVHAARDAARDPASDGVPPFRLARVALGLVVLIIAYASLRPFGGWRIPGHHPLQFLLMRGERGSPFDAILNFVGYLPLGLCLALALFPRIRGLRAFAIGAFGPALCSVLVETLQNYLPGRTPSLLDVEMNALGAVVGAALAVAATPWLADHRGGRHLRGRWLVPGHLTEYGLLVLAAWFVALFAERTLLFGTGDFRANLRITVDPHVPAVAHAVTEVFLVAANLTVAAVLVRLILTEGAPRLRCLFALLAAALCLRLVAQLAFWETAAWSRWITPATLAGLAFGALGARWAMGLSRRAAASAALVLLAASVIVVNASPPDPGLWLQSTAPRQHILIGLALVARYTAKAWPAAAAAFLWLAFRRAAAAR